MWFIDFDEFDLLFGIVQTNINNDVAPLLMAHFGDFGLDILDLGHDVITLDVPTDENGGVFSRDLNFIHGESAVIHGESAVVLHYSIPITKLAYPEPFIASASMMHSDLWFIHILIYQYWLWFVFIFIIIFFFITFVTVVRWCNIRIRPRRETRGVSRSKCGDLITACVPVSWATSIIVHESTDAIDLYDGFGTTELVIGIRAYQWGWEYYYPKDLDLNYNFKKNFSLLIGKSFKYHSAPLTTLKSQRMWRFYQNKNFDSVVNPLSINSSNSGNSSIGLSSYKNLGASPLIENVAFKRISYNNKVLENRTSLTSNIGNNAYDSTFLFSTPLINSIYISKVYSLLRQNSFLSSRDYTLSRQTFFNNNRLIFSKQINLINYLPPIFFPLNTITNSTDNWNFFKIQQNITSNTQQFLFQNNLIDLKFFNRLSFSNDTKLTHSERMVRLESSPLFNVSNINFNSLINMQNNLFHSLISNNTSMTTHLNYNFISPQYSSTYTNTYLQLSTYFDLTWNPLLGKWPLLSSAHYDSSESTWSVIPTQFQSKDDDVLPNILPTYWNSLWLTSHPQWRNDNIELFLINELKITPTMFNLFYDYEFRNWQLIELVEDIFWETINAGFVIDDWYRKFFGDELFLKREKDDKPYWLEDKSMPRTKFNLLFNNPGLELISNVFTSLNPLSIESEIIPPMQFTWNLNTHDFDTSLILKSFEGEVELINQWRDLGFFSNHLISFLYGSNHFTRSSNSLVDSFRSDWESTGESLTTTFLNEHDLFINTFNTNLDNLWENNLLIPLYTSNPIMMGDFLNLRLSAKNLIVSANALIKVFKPRYDDNRSLARLSDFSDLIDSQPLITTPRYSFESWLNKNSFQDISLQFYTHQLLPFYLSSFDVIRFQSTPLFDLPFLESLKSESARYLWIDWYAKWGMIDVQPSSSSRYSILGVPYFNKGFNFIALNNSEFNDTENYFSRLSQARKNYIPTWVLKPYFLTNHNLKNNSFYELYQLITLDWDILIFQLNLLTLLNNWMGVSLNSNNLNFFLTPSNQSYTRSFQFSINNQTLFNIAKASIEGSISKRELAWNSLTPQLPHSQFLTNTTYNTYFLPIWNTIDSIFSSLNKTQTSTTLDLIKSNQLLYKNQYRPMRKGVNNLLRLHATGAIALPIEIRLQVLASSKDVIHSWAVPSAGIKIDCVPGYSSHRVMMFLVSGIFWGQCMEICGRYHHWMPIVVYFMKRDLFWLWCSHFVFYSSSQNSLNTLDNQFANKSGIVSFDRLSWLDEL